MLQIIIVEISKLANISRIFPISLDNGPKVKYTENPCLTIMFEIL